MKVTVSRRELLEVLELHRRFVKLPKGFDPILAYCLLRTVGGRLEIFSSDGNHQVRAQLDAAVHQRGEHTVPTHQLYRIAKTSRGTAVEIASTEKGVQVLVEDSLFLLPSAQGEIPEQGLEGKIATASTLPLQVLRWLLGAVLHAAGDEKSASDSIELESMPGALHAIALDGARAAHAWVELEAEQATLGPIYVIADSARRLLGIKAECMVAVALDADKWLHLALGSKAWLACRTFDRTYPKVVALIEQYRSGATAVVQRVPLLAALDRAQTILTPPAVGLAAIDETLVLAGDCGVGSVTDRLAAVTAGAGDVYINAELAADLVASLEASEVRLTLGKALVVEPVVQSRLAQHQMAVLMPMERPEKEGSATQPPEAQTIRKDTKRREKKAAEAAS